MDWFVKSKLLAEYYIRYVDDFVILERDREKFGFYKRAIGEFLKENLKIELHTDKSKILCLGNSINFLGFRVFFHHKLLKTSNLRKMGYNFSLLKENYGKGETAYDDVYDFIEGWIAYAKNADTYKLRKKITEEFKKAFPGEISTKEINRYLKIQKKEDYAPCTNTGKRHGIHPTTKVVGILPTV